MSQHDDMPDLQIQVDGGVLHIRRKLTAVDIDPHCRHCHLRIFHVVRFGERIWVHETGNATCALHSAEPEEGVE